MADNPPRYLVTTKCICESSKINISKFPDLQALLPADYSYRVCEVTKLDANRFVSRFRVNISSKDEALAWFSKFQLLTNTVFNKDRTFKENSPNIVYKVDMKCHHNTKPSRAVKRPNPRHTRCPARLAIIVRQVELSRNYQSTDIHLNEFPMTVLLHHRHNHAIDYNAEKHFLERIKPPDFIPLLKQPKGPGLIQNLQSYIEEYNADRHGRFSELTIHDEVNFSITLVSPLMKRVLEHVPETADVLFADSIVKIEPYSCKLYLLLTDSLFGGLPVGFILTTSDDEDILDRALESFKSFLNCYSFYSQGVLGPKVVLVDDKQSGKKSFRKAFPSSMVSMCTYRVLQAAWRFTMDDSTGIPRDRRLDFFSLLQQMVYCPSKEQLSRLFDNIMTCPSTAIYLKYISYAHKMYVSRREWAKCLKGRRRQVDQSTSQVCESAMRMVHENILKWKKALSITELFHYIASDTESFYENHLATMANGRPIAYLKRNFKMDDFSSEKVGLNSYTIKSTKTNRMFYVESEIGICSCLNGRFGGMCKHQILVSVKYDESGSKSLENDAVRKAALHFIATGQNDASNTSHSTVLPGESETQEISVVVNRTEFDRSEISSILNSDSDEMSDNDDMVEQMQITHDDEIPPTPTDQTVHAPSVDPLLALSKKQNDAPKVVSPFRTVIQPSSGHILFVRGPVKPPAEPPSSTPVLSAMNASDAATKRTEMKTQLKAVFHDILIKMRKSGDTLQAVEDFIKTYKTLSSESSVNSALRTFGKSNDSAC